MPKEHVVHHVRQLLLDNEDLSVIGNCRNATLLIASYIRDQFPDVKVQYLVYPEERAGFGVHYALLVSGESWQLLLNPVPAPGFPAYIGDLSQAVPTFAVMKRSQIVR